MDQNFLEKITSQINTGLDDVQAAQTVLDSLDKLELDDSTEIGDQLLSAIGARPGIAINLLQQIIDQNLSRGQTFQFLLEHIIKSVFCLSFEPGSMAAFFHQYKPEIVENPG